MNGDEEDEVVRQFVEAIHAFYNEDKREPDEKSATRSAFREKVTALGEKLPF